MRDEASFQPNLSGRRAFGQVDLMQGKNRTFVRRENFANIACFDHFGNGGSVAKQPVLHERGGSAKYEGSMSIKRILMSGPHPRAYAHSQIEWGRPFGVGSLQLGSRKVPHVKTRRLL